MFPFSEIDKGALLEALSSSGLNINANSTSDEIYLELKRAFPGNITSSISNYVNFNSVNDGQWKYQFYSLPYNLTGYNTLTFTISGIGYLRGSSDGKYHYDQVQFSVGVGLSPTSFSVYNQVNMPNGNTQTWNVNTNLSIDVKNLTGKYYIGIGIRGINTYTGEKLKNVSVN